MKKLFKVTIFSMVLVLVFLFSVSCGTNKVVEKASKGLSTYDIKACFDDQNKTVSAEQKVEFVNNEKVTLDRVCFNLYGRAFREGASVKPYTSLNEGKCFPSGVNYGDLTIDKVKVNGEEQSFSYIGEDENALEIKLKTELEPSDKVDIQINFNLSLAECVHRLGYYKSSVNLGNWFPILAMYEKGDYVIDPYYSTGDPFYSDIANYFVEFIFPQEYTLSSTGVAQINEEKNTAKISAKAVRDFAIFLNKDCKTVAKKQEKIQINYLGYENDENMDEVVSIAQRAVKFFNLTFGNYPYETLNIVKAPFLHGGMEYPSVVIISDIITEKKDIAKVVVHEIAHQWWYGVVGNNEITEAWLDESLAEYSTILFMAQDSEFDNTYEELIGEAIANYTLFADILSSLNRKINTSMLLKVNEYASEYEYSYMIYVRGVLMFDGLKQLVGQDKLIKSFKKYYSNYKFKIATTDDLIATIKKTTGKNIEGVMESWLTGKTVVGML